MKKEIKAIIFDVGGVLEVGRYSILTFRRHRSLSVHSFMAKQFNIDLDQWFDSIDTAYTESIVGKLTKKQTLERIAKNVNTTPEHLEKLFIKSYQKHFKRNNKLYQLAFKLKEAGYKIAILSDQWPVSKEVLIRDKDASRFDVVVISHEVGFRKPNPKIYTLTLKKLKLKANQTLFIDNQIWNIKPAKKLGMNTILFKNNHQTIKELKKLGVN